MTADRVSAIWLADAAVEVFIAAAGTAMADCGMALAAEFCVTGVVAEMTSVVAACPDDGCATISGSSASAAGMVPAEPVSSSA